MGHKEKLRLVFRCAWITYQRWITDSRMVILSVLLLFDYILAVAPLNLRAEQIAAPLNLLEPFIAVGNSGMILLILPIVFLILISDFPRSGSSSLFYLYRIGRKNWLYAQLLSLLLMVLSYLIIIAAGAILPMIGNCFVGGRWSLVVTEYAVRFPETSASYELLPENLYYQIGNVWRAAGHTYCLLAMYLFSLGLLVSLGALNHKHKSGVIAAGFLIAAGSALCSLQSKLMWCFPMSHTVVWLHYTKYFRKPVIELGWSYLYFLVIIGVLLICLFRSVKQFQFGDEE